MNQVCDVSLPPSLNHRSVSSFMIHFCISAEVHTIVMVMIHLCYIDFTFYSCWCSGISILLQLVKVMRPATPKAEMVRIHIQKMVSNRFRQFASIFIAWVSPRDVAVAGWHLILVPVYLGSWGEFTCSHVKLQVGHTENLPFQLMNIFSSHSPSNPPQSQVKLVEGVDDEY